MKRTGRKENLDAVPHYHEIRDALAQPGCPFCRLQAVSADRFIDAVLWEQVNDPGTRAELNQARGYCQQHAWLLVRPGAALGVAILTRDVIKTLLDALDSTPVEKASRSVFHSLRRGIDDGRVSRATAELTANLHPQTACPLCLHVQDLELAYSHTLLAHLDGPGSLAEAYHASDGLCLPHFRQTLARVPSSAEADLLVAAQRSVWQRLENELVEFIRKNDHRFRDETFGPERDAWRRALESISGPPPRSESGRHGLTQSI
ncbi:MAG TPA: DUF6062 family protein [Anaerolineae bacterium]|nr:DUF6062 family protein [Anaerolineae bacterium]